MFGQTTAKPALSTDTKNSTQDTADTPNQNTPNLIGVAHHLNYNLQTGNTHTNDVAFASNALHAHGYAKNIHYDNNTHTLQQVMFSTCPPNKRHWQLNATEITLNPSTGRAIAKNSTLKIHNTTVLKLPYFNFPIDTRRASGFLLPTGGLNSQDGLELSLPYYFNLAPNYDATLTTTLFTNRNPMVSGEVRYLSQKYGTGKLDAAYLFSDKYRQGQNRSRLFFDHHWQSTKYKNLTLTALYRYVSDSNYLSDFDNLNAKNNTLNPPRQLSIRYHRPSFDASIKLESFQKLAGNNLDGTPITDKDRPYARLPQIHLAYRLPTDKLGVHLSNLIVDGTSDTAYFKKSINDNSDTEKSGVRAYNQLAFSYPLVKSWGYITPKATIAHLIMVYDKDSRQMQSLKRTEGTYTAFVPSFSLDTGLHFEKSGTAFGFDDSFGGYQLLSPRLKYLYANYKDQSKIPAFDTSLASPSYEQLLADSWFLGYDRLANLHAITPALNYRYIDKTGLTRLDLGIANQHYLSRAKTDLGGHQPFLHKSSGVAWQVAMQPYANFWLDMQGTFKPNYSIDTLIVATRYQPTPDILLNGSFIKRKANPYIGQSPLSAYTAQAIVPLSTILPTNTPWQLLAQGQYDARQHQFMDALVGLTYEDCCLGFAIYGRRYRNDLRPDQAPNRAIMAEIRLGKLANSGRLYRLLSEKIPNFNQMHTWHDK